MTSERIFEIGLAVYLSPVFLAEKMPRGIIRFIAILIAIPCCFVTVLLSAPFLLFGTVLQIWEASNDQP